MTLSANDLEALVLLFEQSKWRELDLQVGDSRLYLGRDANGRASWDASRTAPVAAAPAGPALPTATAAAKASAAAAKPTAAPVDTVAELPEGCVAVNAPSLGTFYRAAKSGAAPFVEVGGRVTEQTELCLIEVMKLFTTLQAGVAGTVREVLAKDGDLVESGQPLFVIDTNG